jgi:hypothetical protein
MPVVELATPAETAAVSVPFSVRLAARRQARASAAASAAPPPPQLAPQERRAYVRRGPGELAWLRAARLKHGPGVALVDLSEGGALLDAQAPLKPGARLVLELEGEGGELRVPLSVLRSHVTRIDGELMIYRGACAFGAPVDLGVLIAASDASRGGFAGIDQALAHLVARLATPAGRRADALDGARIVHVLESLQTRAIAGGGDVYGRGVAALLAAIIPALHRGMPAADIAPLVDDRVNDVIIGGKYDAVPSAARLKATQARLTHTADLLKQLLATLPASVESRPAPAACSEQSAPPPPAAADVSAAWQKIVVRYREGRLLKGFTQDFHPSRGHFSLWPSITSGRSERVIVPFSRLKAVFFVRDFEGNPTYIERDVSSGAAAGRRVEVTFVDNEVVRGTTLNYRPDGYGFFVVPADPKTNNQRIFVVSGALRHVRFP